MPANKYALIRYRVINRCLKDYQFATMDKLIQVCEDALSMSPISERTIYQDLRDMREDDQLGYYAPIRLNRDKGYYYDDPDYSIDNIPLGEEEVKALSFAATMLDQFRNISIFSTFTGAVQKVVEAMNIKRLSKEDDLLPFIEFEHSPVSLGQQFIEPIILAIKNKKVIRFKYQRFVTEKVLSHDIHPYLLKQYHSRWYLIGLHDYHEDVATYCLDRIVSDPEVVDIPYKDIGFNTREYFKSVIGIITSFEKPQKVVLKLTPHQAWYVITQPIHPSQKVTEKKDHFIVELKVIPTYELIMLIMGWGPEVEVIQPKSLKSRIFELHKKCTDRH
ncbi:MAG TPA: WYL domain-containing protein [Bacteroidales bacterium]|nr:WYL domain-containing protein [Bacteroidales bacterium]HPT10011.1 WYL domain-containing protein [Bacteroidales bacterium]